MTQVLDFVLVGTKGFEPLTPTVSGLFAGFLFNYFGLLWAGRLVLISDATRLFFEPFFGGDYSILAVWIKGVCGGDPPPGVGEVPVGGSGGWRKWDGGCWFNLGGCGDL